jgi:hypothetical protein
MLKMIKKIFYSGYGVALRSLYEHQSPRNEKKSPPG